MISLFNIVEDMLIYVKNIMCYSPHVKILLCEVDLEMRFFIFKFENIDVVVKK